MSRARGSGGVDRGAPRPAAICRQLLAALDASEGRRRRRKRDTRPDAIGLAIKRRLLESAVRADPDADAFEGWLLERCGEELLDDPRLGTSSLGARRAMAREVLAEWRYALASEPFRGWLEQGAPSADHER